MGEAQAKEPLNDDGTRQLTAAIIASAVNDLDNLYNRIMKVLKHKSAGDLQSYVEDILRKQRSKKEFVDKKKAYTLPFDSVDDKTAVAFFHSSNKWAWTLLNAHGIYGLPTKIVNQLEVAKKYYKEEKPVMVTIPWKAKRNVDNDNL